MVGGDIPLNTNFVREVNHPLAAWRGSRAHQRLQEI